MAAKISAEDLAKFPPEIQKQILAELTPAPETPKAPAEWFQVGYVPSTRTYTQPSPRPAQPHATQPRRATQTQRTTATRMPRKPHKSYLWLYILVAYILLISACLLPGLLMKP